MKVFETANIRNVAVVGHGGCGKTTLVSAILFDTGRGQPPRPRGGRVHRHRLRPRRDRAQDQPPDRPGLGRVAQDQDQLPRRPRLRELPLRGALRAAGGGRGAGGGGRRGRGRGADREGLGLRRGVRRCPASSSSTAWTATARRSSARWSRSQRPSAAASCPSPSPSARRRASSGVADLVNAKADVYTDDQSGKFQTVDLPPDVLEDAATLAREARRDGRGEQRRPDGGVLREGHAARRRTSCAACARACWRGRSSPSCPPPRCATSGCTRSWTPSSTCCPRPVDRGRGGGHRPATRAEITREPPPTAPFSAFVFKTVADPHAGRISLFRVYSGTFKSDSTVYNSTRDALERVGHLRAAGGQDARSRCRRSRPATSARWPSSRTRTPATRCATRRSPSCYPPVVYPEPATTFAIEPKTRGDEDKISSALHRLMEEDPVLRLTRDPQTHELLLTGHGPAAHRGRGRQAEASATRSRSTSRSRRSPTARRSRARRRATGGTRSRPAATASSATARSA